MIHLDANQKIIMDGLKAIAGFQQGEDPIRRGLLHALWNFVKVRWQLKCTLNIVFCEVDTMRLVIRTRKMRKNIYGKKKYLEEGMRGKLIGHS